MLRSISPASSISVTLCPVQGPPKACPCLSWPRAQAAPLVLFWPNSQSEGAYPESQRGSMSVCLWWWVCEWGWVWVGCGGVCVC